MALDARFIRATWTEVHHTEDSMIGQGGRRPVGIEIEFGGLGADRAASAIRHRFGGTEIPVGQHCVRVEGTEFGDFVAKLDWRWVQNGATDQGGFVSKAKDLIGEIGREVVVPTEIVTPPLPAGRIPEIDSLVRDLVRLGAEGTRTGLLRGFGLHLNPSLGPADLAAEPIRRVLQAYLLESPALREAIGVDPMRNLLSFVDPFPQAYVDHVLAPEYAPSLDGLIGDYLHFNPTRNRELDLLPLFAELDKERVREAVADPHVSSRPTFHWRLPNADIEDFGWSVAREWTRWIGVEELATDAERLLDRLVERYDRVLRRTNAWGSLV